MIKNFQNFFPYPVIWNICIFCIFLVLVLGFILYKKTPHFKKKPASMMMPGYQVIYTDQKEKEKKENIQYGTLLYSAKYNLQGKPDYIFKNRISGRLFPVEIKSGTIGESPYPHQGDLLQLAAYFLIIEDVYGRKPKSGRLVYKDYMFQVKNTARIRKEVTKTISRMHQMLRTGTENAKANFAHCRYCVCNGTVCESCQKQNAKKG